MRGALPEALRSVSETCTECKTCVKECAFLSKYGTPKEIADSCNPEGMRRQALPFECSLCGLCSAVCPVKIDPAGMFLEMRRAAVMRGAGDFPEHAGILGYEKRGTSPKYTYYGLPDGCSTVFFPGCTLPGTRPERTKEVFLLLKKAIPTLGIVLDCCAKPSHDLGRTGCFTAVFGEMRRFLLDHGVKKVIVACPNCHKVFSRYGSEIEVETVYELMARNRLSAGNGAVGKVTIHDPCALREHETTHRAVRDLVKGQGLQTEEMAHSGKLTLCCGEGGSVGFLSPELSKKWGMLRKDEAAGRRIITYCAGCATYLGALTPTSHVLDLLFEPQATMEGTVKAAKAPFTYRNRIRLKKEFKKLVDARGHRERPLPEKSGKGNLIKRLFLAAMFIGAILAVHLSGAVAYLEKDALQRLIESYGALAPLIFVLIYTIAPVLFLPGLPLTIAAGVLFGPFWGVVYSITGATLGACLAFLVSRYGARGWVERRLQGPRWQQLDKDVAQQGWKIVAIMRLIPLLPFNLLNYAFGLTKIRFLHFALASLIFMLPGAIAYVVFSSSLLDVIEGTLPPAFFIGLGLIVLGSLLPLLYRRYKARNEQKDPG